eukprot:Seg21621.1 transcript_id=Seg21621.1/GoldUCD/mRNA.D3Y31 product="hypothetical protein" protein_id=Seg21621.1/GoldUCD/D3Y31
MKTSTTPPTTPPQSKATSKTPHPSSQTTTPTTKDNQGSVGVSPAPKMLYTKCDACDGNGDCWCEDGWLPEGITDRQVERIVKSSESNPQNTACNAVTESILESMIKDLEVPDDVEPDDVQDFEQVTEQIDNVKGDGMHRDSYNFMEDEDIMDDCTIITLDPDKD